MTGEHESGRQGLIDRVHRWALQVQNDKAKRVDEVTLTTGEVALIFQVAHRTVRKWGDRGRLRYVTIKGGYRRYLAIDVWEALQENERH